MAAPLILGANRIERVIERERLSYMPFTQFFPTVTRQMLDENRSWLQPDYLDPDGDKIIIAIQSYVVRSNGLTILIDTCVGNDKPRPGRPWHMWSGDAWHKSLGALGLSVGDIDIVMCTHLHVDHVGWNTRLENGRWVPTFPKARYLFADRELDFWSKRAAGDPASCPWVEDSVLPIIAAGRAEKVTSAHVLSDDIRLVPTPGHTIDHFSVEIGRSSDRKALITGDMVHSPIQVKHPEIGMLSDYDSAEAGATRQRIFAACCEADTLVCTAHFAGNPLGRIRRDGASFRFICEEV